MSIGVAPITQVTHVRNKDSKIQGRSLNVIKVIFHTIKNAHNSLPLGANSFPLREVPILKRDEIEGNHCLIQ